MLKFAFSLMLQPNGRPAFSLVAPVFKAISQYPPILLFLPRNFLKLHGHQTLLWTIFILWSISYLSDVTHDKKKPLTWQSTIWFMGVGAAALCTANVPANLKLAVVKLSGEDGVTPKRSKYHPAIPHLNPKRFCDAVMYINFYKICHFISFLGSL